MIPEAESQARDRPAGLLMYLPLSIWVDAVAINEKYHSFK